MDFNELIQRYGLSDYTTDSSPNDEDYSYYFKPEPNQKTESGEEIIRPFKYASKFWGKKGAGVLIKCSTTGRYLLGLRGLDVNEPNQWGVFGGAIDGKESSKEAAMRELKEETGFVGRIHLRLIYRYQNSGFTFYNYLGTVKEEFKPILSKETSAAKWFNFGKFPKNLHFGVRKLMPILHQIESKKR